MLSNRPAMRDAQARISKRIVGLLGLTAKTFAQELDHWQGSHPSRSSSGGRHRYNRTDKPVLADHLFQLGDQG
jgi:hypothetical protein